MWDTYRSAALLYDTTCRVVPSSPRNPAWLWWHDMRGHTRERSNAASNGGHWEFWVGGRTDSDPRAQSVRSGKEDRFWGERGLTACSLLLLVTLTALLDPHLTRRFRLDETRTFDATRRDPLVTTDISSDD